MIVSIEREPEVVSGLWRASGQVVALRDLTWPRRCVRCNSPQVQARALTVHLRWSPPWVWLLLPLGLLPYVIARVMARQTGRARLFLCRTHERQRVVSAIGTPILLVASTIGGMALASITNVSMFLLIPVAGVIALFVFPRGVVFPTIITSDHMFLRGAGTAFMISLPEYDGIRDSADLHPDLT